ncbi:PTS lactose/cellobiose transporter subunit IIA [Spiroplasma endosymbiont of Aspidapion aeneum]|uniref:PTS lactose/cellobiose transporter subunit IIA n=1 Tax=Spiroplasma endosymbiont of Aspidapion aeneum TaxID=3066276 RepID=UPI00313CDF52
MTKEEMTAKGFELVAYAGDARADYLHAIKLAKEGKFKDARAKVLEADQTLTKAHIAQTDLLTEEAKGNYSDLTLIMVHGQDHLMTTLVIKELVNTIIDLIERK